MGFFTSRKAKMSAYIVYTIEAHSVACAVYLQNDKPEIIFAARENILYSEQPDAKRILTKVAHACKSTLSSRLRAFISQYADQYEFVRTTIIHSLLWSHEETRHLSHHEPKEFEITESFLNEIIDKEHANINPKDSYVVVRSSISNMHINGYITSHMFGKKVKHFSCKVDRILVDKVFLETLEEIIETTVRTPVVFHTTAFDLFDVFIPFVGAESTMVAMSFGSETTEISVYNHRERKNSLSVPYGIDSCLRDVSKKTQKDISLTFSHIKSHIAGDMIISKAELESFEFALNNLRQKINKALFDAGESLNNLHSIICIYPEPFREISGYFIKNHFMNKTTVIMDPYTTRVYKDSLKIAKPMFYTDPLIEISVLSAASNDIIKK